MTDWRVRDIDRVRDELVHGRGFAVLEGVEVDGLDDRQLEDRAAEVASRVGTLVPQGPGRARVMHVCDRGADPADPATRSYQHSERLGFHADPTDVVALLCVRPALTGGRSAVVDSAAVHDALTGERPDLARILYEPFWFDRPERQEPVWSISDGQLRVNYGPDRMRHDRLTAAQAQALEALDRLHHDPRFRVDMDLRPGDLQFLNNHKVLHARTAYRDDPARPRHLIRVWLSL